MSKKLNSVLLVDDDEITNFIHERIIQASNCIEQINATQTGKDALEYLQRQYEEGFPKPDLILLDINMPGMNGWEFLSKFRRLPDHLKNDITIVMLTTSQNPDDETRASKIPEVSDFLRKPLSIKAIYTIIDKHFHEQMLVEN